MVRRRWSMFGLAFLSAACIHLGCAQGKPNHEAMDTPDGSLPSAADTIPDAIQSELDSAREAFELENYVEARMRLQNVIGRTRRSPAHAEARAIQEAAEAFLTSIPYQDDLAKEQTRREEARQYFEAWRQICGHYADGLDAFETQEYGTASVFAMKILALDPQNQFARELWDMSARARQQQGDESLRLRWIDQWRAKFHAAVVPKYSIELRFSASDVWRQLRGTEPEK